MPWGAPAEPRPSSPPAVIAASSSGASRSSCATAWGTPVCQARPGRVCAGTRTRVDPRCTLHACLVHTLTNCALIGAANVFSTRVSRSLFAAKTRPPAAYAYASHACMQHTLSCTSATLGIVRSGLCNLHERSSFHPHEPTRRDRRGQRSWRDREGRGAPSTASHSPSLPLTLVSTWRAHAGYRHMQQAQQAGTHRDLLHSRGGVRRRWGALCGKGVDTVLRGCAQGEGGGGGTVYSVTH